MTAMENPEDTGAPHVAQSSEGPESLRYPQPTGELSFEDAYNRLGETVQALESGGLTLEAATNLYEEGMRLIQLCNRLLGTAELKVTQLRDAYSDYRHGGAVDLDFGPEGEESGAES